MEKLLVLSVLIGALCCVFAHEHEGGEGLGRCKRVMCKMNCKYGFQKGEDGCKICECNPSPCENHWCPEGEVCHMEECEGVQCLLFEPECVPGLPDYDDFPCAMPMCANRCENGYKVDARGCMRCECNTPAEVVCPAVMCAMFCEYGFQKSASGCDTCACNPDEKSKSEQSCESMICLPGLECTKKKPLLGCMEDCEPMAICTVPSLCELMGDMDDDDLSDLAGVFGDDEDSLAPGMCRDDGNFESRQCGNFTGGPCWCVNDRGVRVPESELTYDEQQGGFCETRMSDMMKLTFQLEHDLEEGDIDKSIEDIKKLVKQTVGEWVGLQQQSIISVEIDIYGPGIMTVEIDVITDGVIDLPSAAHHIDTRTKNKQDCHFEYEEHCIHAIPGSVHATHLYPDINPTPTTCFFGRYYHHHKMMVIAGCIGVGLLLFLLISIACMVRYKRTGRYQFRHKKFQNMTNFRKNLVLTSEWEKPELVAKDEVSVNLSGDIEKKPLA